MTGSGADEVVLDPAVDAWLYDHEPTWTLPALPMMSMVDRLAGALGVVPCSDRATLRDVQVRRWLPIEQPTRTRVDVKSTDAGPEATLLAFRAARDPKLSRFEPVATGRLSIEPMVSEAPLPPLENAVEQADPYAEGTLFHGPAFRYLVRLALGSNGSTAILDAGRGTVPHGARNQGLLDALTHGIPHDRLHLFSDRIPTDLVAYPYRIPFLRFVGDAPTSGEVRVETRFDGFDGNERFPAFRLQAFVGDRLWVELRLVEILLAKGPIGSAEPWARLAFLRDHRFVAGLGLSRMTTTETRLRESEVKASDWLPGTVAGAYGASGDLVRSVAVKDHVGQRAGVHPRSVIVADDGAYLASEPLRKHPLSLATEGDDLVVRDAGAPFLDVEPVRAFWSRWFGIGRWPVEDIYYGLIERFVGSVHVEDPAALAGLRGRPVLFLGNHQVGIESLLFSVIASSLVETPTLTLAKVEHQETWLGKLIQHCFRYPGARDPGVIAYFDRTDPESLPRIVRQLGAGIAGEAKSLMVHVEGTRSLECRTPVTKMSGVFVDLAIQANVPVVPVRFSGGLPVEPLAERIEFPIGMGRQDHWLGAPIAPEELAALPYKQRIERVMAAINGLGPSNAEEQPGKGDAELQRRVDERVARTGAGVGHATILEVLLDLASPGAELASLLDGVRSGNARFAADAKGAWLEELSRRLVGPA